jgi:hypothetical protein
MRAGVAHGIKQTNQLSLIAFENDFLKMHEKMIPLMSSYTQTDGEEKNNSSKEKSSGGSGAKNINNTGGRPTLPDEKKSEKTEANIKAAG